MAAILSYLTGRLALTPAKYSSIAWRYNDPVISQTGAAMAREAQRKNDETKDQAHLYLCRKPQHRSRKSSKYSAAQSGRGAGGGKPICGPLREKPEPADQG